MVESAFGHVVVAPDKFKGSLSAAQAAAAIARGLRGERPARLSSIRSPMVAKAR